MALDQDAFETVAVSWSQPETAVMLSMFEFYGIPAFALGRWQASIDATFVVAMQGIQVRVHCLAVDDALDLLAGVAERPAAVRPYLLNRPRTYPLILLLAFAAALVGYANWDDPSPLDVVAIWPLSMLLIAIPPTRTPSTFMLWKRSRETPTIG
jgi:hypothetical protein